MSYIRNITSVVYNEYITNLIKKIKDSGIKYDYVVGIPRGGLIPAVYISHAINASLLTYINPFIVDKVNRYLVVDDLTDTGSTLNKFADEFSRRLMYDTAVLFRKEIANITPKYIIEDNVDKDCWLIFPYEEVTLNAKYEQEKHKDKVKSGNMSNILKDRNLDIKFF